MLLNLIAVGERNIASGVMKSFKTIDELVEFVKDDTNIEKLENGDVTLKDWFDLGNLVEKSKKEYTLATNEKKALRKKHEDAEIQIAKLTEQLDTVNNELTGLKSVQPGGEKEELQKLNKEKSEWIAKYNASESKIKDLEKQVLLIPDLERQVEGYKEASNRAIILEAVRKVRLAFEKCSAWNLKSTAWVSPRSGHCVDNFRQFS